MNLVDFIKSIVSGNDLEARQWVKDFKRSTIDIGSFDFPEELNDMELYVAAGVLEMLAARYGKAPPTWTSQIGRSPNQIVLCKYINRSTGLKHLCEIKGPESLLKRNVLAYPDYLDVL